MKEANSKLELDLSQSESKLQKKKAKLSQQREAEQTLGEASREDKAALEQSRDLVLSFKAKLQQNDELFKAKDDEIQNLRDKIEKLTVESAAQNVQITELHE